MRWSASWGRRLVGGFFVYSMLPQGMQDWVFEKLHITKPPPPPVPVPPIEN